MGSVAPRPVGSSRTRDRTHVPCIGRWILTREVPQRNQFDNIVALHKIPQWPPATLAPQFSSLLGPMRPFTMWPQPMLFTRLQPYWPFISFNNLRLLPPQGPSSWILPLPGMPHTSIWQVPSYLGVSSKFTWPSLTLIPQVAHQSLSYDPVLFFSQHKLLSGVIFSTYLFTCLLSTWSHENVRSMKTNTLPALFTTAFPIQRETPGWWWVLYKYLLNEWMNDL